VSRRQSKTLLMLLIERDHHNVPIATLMVQAFEKHGTERAAAQSLGITQQAFNVWKYRLGLAETIDEIRGQFRGDETRSK
jgi:hypothetical protein